MANILDFIINAAGSAWLIMLDSAFFLILGVFLAGVVHLLLNEQTLNRFLGGGKSMTVFKLALLGIPLPLCSCSVLPVAHQLRKSGLTKGGTASFLISTPETGVDSILITYSLTDPLLTVARPVVAFLTAVTAGLAINQLPEDSEPEKADESDPSSCENCCSTKVDPPKSLWEKLKSMVHYSIFDLLADLAPYLLFGFILAGIIGAVIGLETVELKQWFENGWNGYLIALLLGLPLYICATSSTPLAAVLLAAGFSPGAVLVFLMVGPATNLATITVVNKILKKVALAIYLISITVVSVGSGLLLDLLYQKLNFQPIYTIGGGEHQPHLISIISAVLLGGFIIYISLKKLIKRF